MRRRITGLSFALLLVSLISSDSSAQQRASMAPAVAPMMHSMSVAAPIRQVPSAHAAAPYARPVTHPHGPSGHPVSVRTSGHPSSARVPTRVSPNNSPVFVSRPQDFGDAGVPGLGFDYVHLAAVHPNSRHNYHSYGAAFPFVGGSIYVPVPYYGEPYSDQPAADSGEPESPDQSAGPIEPPVEQPAPRVNGRSAAPRPSAEYTFVRRDGSLFFAVAYSWSNGSLQYVTQEGFRKIVPLSSLDLNATSQFNEQRGVTFRAPA